MYVPFHQFGQFVHDGESDAISGKMVTLICTVELFKDMWEFLLRHPTALILYTKGYVFTHLIQMDFQSPILWWKFNRIVDEI